MDWDGGLIDLHRTKVRLVEDARLAWARQSAGLAAV